MKKIISIILCVLSLTSCLKHKKFSDILNIKSENIYGVYCYCYGYSSTVYYVEKKDIDEFFNFINVKYEKCEEKNTLISVFDYKILYQINDVRFSNELYYIDEKIYFEYSELSVDEENKEIIKGEKKYYISKDKYTIKEIIKFSTFFLYSEDAEEYYKKMTEYLLNENQLRNKL